MGSVVDLTAVRKARAQRDADLLRQLLQTSHEIQLVVASRRRDRARLRLEHTRTMRRLEREQVRGA